MCSTENVCPYPGKPSSGKLSGTFPATYRAVAQFECNPGYSLDGDEVMHCQEDGSWRGTKPTCRCKHIDVNVPFKIWKKIIETLYNIFNLFGYLHNLQLINFAFVSVFLFIYLSFAAISCRAQPPNEHVRVLNPQPSYIFGEEVIYRCEEGYVLDGPTARKCVSRDGSAAGRLNSFNPLCKGNIREKCSQISFEWSRHSLLSLLAVIATSDPRHCLEFDSNQEGEIPLINFNSNCI